MTGGRRGEEYLRFGVDRNGHRSFHKVRCSILVEGSLDASLEARDLYGCVFHITRLELHLEGVKARGGGLNTEHTLRNLAARSRTPRVGIGHVGFVRFIPRFGADCRAEGANHVRPGALALARVGVRHECVRDVARFGVVQAAQQEEGAVNAHPDLALALDVARKAFRHLGVREDVVGEREGGRVLCIVVDGGAVRG